METLTGHDDRLDQIIAVARLRRQQHPFQDTGVRTTQVVLAHAGASGDGVVVSGSRLPPGRLDSRDSPRGVVTATVSDGEQFFGALHLARLEALAEEAGRCLGPQAGAREDEDFETAELFPRLRVSPAGT